MGTPILGVQNGVDYFSLWSQRFLRNVDIFFLACDICVRRRSGMVEIGLFQNEFMV